MVPLNNDVQVVSVQDPVTGEVQQCILDPLTGQTTKLGDGRHILKKHKLSCPKLFFTDTSVVTVTDPVTGQLVQQVVQTVTDPKTGETKQVIKTASTCAASPQIITVQDPLTGQPVQQVMQTDPLTGQTTMIPLSDLSGMSRSCPVLPSMCYPLQVP